MNKLSLAIIAALLVLFTTPIATHAQTTDKRARRWRVMVIVPETHLYRPHIPDPAVETELSKQLIDAGYKVVDQGRISDLRYSRVMDRILQGGPTTKAEVIRLGRKFGADLLVTGEAFSQLVTQKTVNTDLGQVAEIQCRARVELRAIRMDTGEKIYADAIQKTGSPDSTEELASKACLEEAAEDIGPSMIARLDQLALSPTRTMELSIRGVGSQTRAQQIEDIISHMSGVTDVSPGDFDSGTDETEITLSNNAVRTFGSRLETDTHLKRFRLRIQSSNGSKIIVNCK